MNRVYYVRVSDDRQDNDRQIHGLKEWAKKNGDDHIPEWIWEAALKKQPLPDACPVQWDHGSRDMAETRPAFQKIVRRIERQDKKDKQRLGEFVIYELDRFGVEGVDEWFHYRYVFRKAGCSITSTLKGDLSANDIRTQIETLFAAMTSREEQKKTAGRVADAKASIARAGDADRLGGSPPFAYDRCCVDRKTGKVLYRIHYLELSSKLKKRTPCERLFIQYDDDGNEIRRQTVRGAGEIPKPTTSQKWQLFPSIDESRVRAVRLIFKWLKEEFPAVSILGICKRLASLGLTTYKGKGWHYDFVTYVAKQPDYTGFRGYNKRRAGRHKTHVPGKGQQDIPEDEKGKYLFRPPEEWVLSPEPTHEAIIDQDTYRVVQEKLAARATRERAHAPMNDRGFLKPLLYCAGCGRQMTCWTIKGVLKYRCPTYQLRYQNPGTAAYQTECGVNAVAHDAVWALVREKVKSLRLDIDRRLEVDERETLLEELLNNKELYHEISRAGLNGYLSRLYKVFDLGEQHYDSVLEREVFALWEDGVKSNLLDIPTDIQERIARLEKAKVVLARQILDQLGAEHRQLTLALAKGPSERQAGVLASEINRIEERMEELESAQTPILDHIARLEDRRVEIYDRLDFLEKTMREGNNRAVGGALAGIYDRIVVSFGKRDKTKPKKRHQADSPWLPEKTEFIPKVDHQDGASDDTPNGSGDQRVPGDSSSDRNLDSVHGSPRMW